MSAAPVMAVFDFAEVHAAASPVGAVEKRREVRDARDAVAELLAADQEHDQALIALRDLNRRIAEQGWLEIEHDALREAGMRYARAVSRRVEALERFGVTS